MSEISKYNKKDKAKDGLIRLLAASILAAPMVGLSMHENSGHVTSTAEANESDSQPLLEQASEASTVEDFLNEAYFNLGHDDREGVDNIIYTRDEFIKANTLETDTLQVVPGEWYEVGNSLFSGQ